jgi:hypothetical protein
LAIKISLGPRAAFAKAPATIKATYLAMVLTGILVFADSVTNSAILGFFGNGWWIALAAFIGYFFADAGLLVLRARGTGRNLAYALPVGVSTWEGLDIAAGHAPAAGVIAFVLSALTIIAVSLPASLRHFATAEKRPSTVALAASKKQRAAVEKQQVAQAEQLKSGSFADLQRQLEEDGLPRDN